MRGDGTDDFLATIETCRTAFQLRRPDARQRTSEALSRAKRAGDRDQASALSKILGEHRNRRLADVDEGPLPELVVQSRSRRGDTIEALISNGSLEWRHEAAALSIASVVEALTSPLAVRAPSWERGRVDGGSNGALAMPERLAGLYTDRYKPWAAWMSSPASMFQLCTGCGRLHTPAARLPMCWCGVRRLWRVKPHLPLVLSIVCFGSGIEVCARQYQTRRQRALRLLRCGLDRYADFG